MKEQLVLLPGYLTAHLQLALSALIIAALVSIPLGILVTRVRWLESPVVGVASVIQTIPSLALLAVMVPVLAAIDLQSIGFLPAFIALTLYGVLPILRNTVTGIGGVDPALLEAARGVGMTPWQQLRLVELPLAMPVVIAGVRTSTVWVVGIATLSTPVGAPSLGNYIFTGLQTRNYTAVLVGCVAAAVLALVLDGLVHLLEVGMRDRKRLRTVAACLGLGALVLYTGVTGVSSMASHNHKRIVVGAKTFTEQYILSDIIAKRIRDRTDVPVQTMQSLGSSVAFDALRQGNVDIYVDYSGTIWANDMHRHDVPKNRAVVLQKVKKWLGAHGVVVVATLGFQNSYALAMREDKAQRLGVRTIGDLTPFAPQLAMGGDYEFFGRVEWRQVRDIYGLHFRKRRSMDPSLMYQAVQHGDVDVISALSTDGRIESMHLRVLKDNRNAMPPYDAMILANAKVARAHPKVIRALKSLDGTIDNRTMRRLNMKVDGLHQNAQDVAAHFLQKLGK